MCAWPLYRRLTVLKRVVISVAAVGVLGLLGFFALAWRPSIAPIDLPAKASFSAELIAKGEVLAGAGYCAVCHTAKGGQKFAGGYPMPTPFGVLYSTNITPDPETGIGTWSEAAFARAMHEGVARDGSHLFPGFPYDHFTKLSDDDVKALYAYFMTRPPVRASAPANTIPFPLNIRALQEGWKILSFRSGRFEPVAGKSAEWNRGAYLALGLSHCGRLPHAAQPARRGIDGRRLCRRGGRQLDRPAVDRRKPCSRAVDAGGATQLFAQRHECSARDHGGTDVSRRAWSCRTSRIGCPGHRSVFRRHRPCGRPLGIPRASSGACDVLRTPRHRAGVRRRRAPLPGRLRVLSLQLRPRTARGPAGPRAQQRAEPARSHQPDPSRAAWRQRGGRYPGRRHAELRAGLHRRRYRAHCRLSPSHSHELAALARPRREGRRHTSADQCFAVRIPLGAVHS